MTTEATEDAAQHTLQERLLASAVLSVDRFPMLQVVFERMAISFSDTIRQMSAAPIYFFVKGVTAERIGDLKSPSYALGAAYHAAELDLKILVGADRKSIFLLTEALFGSDGSEPAYEEDRGLTNVEDRVAQFAFDHLTKALRSSFSSVADVSFDLKRAESKLDFATIGRKNSFAVTCRCHLQAFDRESELFIVIPQSALNPFRDALSRNLSGEGPLHDPRWAKQMQDRVTQTEVTVHAVMEKRDFTLNDVACLEVGQVIRLPISPTSLIKLESENQALFWCTLGQKDGFYTIRIEDFVDENQEFIDDVLGN